MFEFSLSMCLRYIAGFSLLQCLILREAGFLLLYYPFGNQCCSQEEHLCVCARLCVLDSPCESSARPNMKINGSQGMFVFNNRSIPSVTSAQNVLTCEQSCGIWNSIYLLYSIYGSSVIFFFHSGYFNLYVFSLFYMVFLLKLKLSVVNLK